MATPFQAQTQMAMLRLIQMAQALLLLLALLNQQLTERPLEQKAVGH